MAAIRSFVTIKPISTKTSVGTNLNEIRKGINRTGLLVEGIANNYAETAKLIQFEREWLRSNTQSKVSEIKEEEREKANIFAKSMQSLKKALSRRQRDTAEAEAEKGIDEANKEGIKDEVKKPIKSFLETIGSLLGTVAKYFIIFGALNWLEKNPEGAVKFFRLVYAIGKFAFQLTKLGIGGIMDGLTNIFGDFSNGGMKENVVKRGLRFFIGVLQFAGGLAMLRFASYLIMPWKLFQDVNLIRNIFLKQAQSEGEMKASAEARKTGYKDTRTGIVYTKEEYEQIKKSTQRADKKRGKQAGKGLTSNLYENELNDRFQAQYEGKPKGRLGKLQQRGRIAGKKMTRSISKFAKANPGKVAAGFSVLGGGLRIASGLASGEGAGKAVGAGVGQAAGGILGGIAGTALLGPFLGPFAPIVGNAIGSFLGEWVGGVLGPIIEPIFKPIGRYFGMMFEVLGAVMEPFKEAFGELFSALFDFVGQLGNAIMEVASILWDFYRFVFGPIFSVIGDVVGFVVQNAKRLMDPGSVAQGIGDALTFNLFDFDKQNQKAAGGRVDTPSRAVGGPITSGQPGEAKTLSTVGNTMLDAVVSGIGGFGFAGGSKVQSFISADVTRLRTLFGASGSAGNTGASGSPSGRMQTAVTIQNVGADNLETKDTSNEELYKAVSDENKGLKGVVKSALRIFTANQDKKNESNNTNGASVAPGGGGGGGDGGGGTHAGPSTGPSSYEGTSWNKDPAFAEATNKVAKYFNIRANDLLGLMASESGLRPNADNGKHVGLIQFGASQAKGAGTTQAELKRMSRAEQMPYVQKYLENAKLPKGASAGHLYTAVFLPAFVTKPADFIIANKQGTLPVGYPESRRWYSSNRGLDMNNDGKLTIAELGERIQKKKREFKIPMAKGGFLRFARGGEMTASEAGPEVDPKTGQHTNPKMKKREELGKKRLKAFAGGGQLAKLDFSKGAKPALAARGRCTEGVILTAEKNRANIGAPDVYTSKDPNNPRGLMAQAVGRFGWGAIPGLGKSRSIKSPYGNVSVNSMSWAEWIKAVKGGKIPSGALVFSTERGWNYSGGSSGNDSAIAQEGGKKLWSGHWQYQYEGNTVGGVYGPATKEVVALTHPGGNGAGYDGSTGGADPGGAASATGGGATGAASEPEKPRTVASMTEELEKLLMSFGEAMKDTQKSFEMTPQEQETPPKPGEKPAPTKPKIEPSTTKTAEQLKKEQQLKAKAQRDKESENFMPAPTIINNNIQQPVINTGGGGGGGSITPAPSPMLTGRPRRANN